MSVRTLSYFIPLIDEEKAMKQFHSLVPKILPALFSGFTNDEVTAHGREIILEVFYLCLRTISWADGIDNELVSGCLNETFNSWMALFLQIIQTNPKAFFDIKKNALSMSWYMRGGVTYEDVLNMSTVEREEIKK